MVATPPTAAWVVLSAGDGTTVPHIDDRALMAIRLLGEPDRSCWPQDCPSLADTTDLAHDVRSGPAAAGPAQVVRVARARQAIEEGIQVAKREVELAGDEGRRNDGWGRDVTCWPTPSSPSPSSAPATAQ